MIRPPPGTGRAPLDPPHEALFHGLHPFGLGTELSSEAPADFSARAAFCWVTGAIPEAAAIADFRSATAPELATLSPKAFEIGSIRRASRPMPTGIFRFARIISAGLAGMAFDRLRRGIS